tara:strand:+ start:571 stop:801 length:231 start_codon:yes stop_codon:yes gene_type:complete
MKQDKYFDLLQYIAEEMAHAKFEDEVSEWNVDEQKFYFTDRANKYIHHQIRDLDIVFETYGVKPKGSLIDKIRKLL